MKDLKGKKLLLPRSLQAEDLLAEGHPWEAVRECLRLRANSRIALAQLVGDIDLHDFTWGNFSSATSDVEGGDVLFDDILQEEAEEERRRAKHLSVTGPPQ